jgi:phospholipid/cholesterol/gamma-HCH transport system substrate-binding protein
MRKPHFATDFSVGFVLFVATVVVIASLFLVGDGQNFFADHVEYQVALPSAGGLKTGSKVLLGGVQAGSVRRISFSPDLTSNEVLLSLAIEKSYKDRIREDSFAWLENQGLLGDACIYVKLGVAGDHPLPQGSMIRYKDHPMLDSIAGEEIRESTTGLLKALTSVLSDASQGQGTLGQFLKNPELYNNLNTFTRSMAVLTQDVAAISKELKEVIAEVKSQKGTLGQLIFSEDYARSFATAVREASVLVGSLREIVDAVKTGKGSVGKLFADDSFHDAGKRALEGLGRASARLDDLLAKAESSRSVLGRVMTDERMGQNVEELVSRLERSAASLESVLGIVERGEGSVGMLVHDPSVATSLRDVFRGVSDSGLMQNAVRNAERDGREAYLRDSSLAKREAEEVLRVRALRRLEQTTPASDSSGVPVPASGRVDASAPDARPSGEADEKNGK